MNPAVQRLLVITASITAFSSAVPLREHGFRNGAAPHLTPTFNPELGSLTEGDIILSPKTRWSRNAIIDPRKRWPNARVPYEMNSTLSLRQKKGLMESFKEFHEQTCVRFVKRNEERDYIYINSSRDECSSYVGRQGGMQIINLAEACFNQKGTPIHELMHALGLWHEQSRRDRDDFITIRLENIPKRDQHNFEIRPETETFNQTYDFGSLMHYHPKAFSWNGEPTIEAKKEYQDRTAEMGQRNYFSESDLVKIEEMYCRDSDSPDPDYSVPIYYRKRESPGNHP